MLLAALALAAGPAGAQGMLGPQGPTSWQPEVDAYFRLSDGVRLQAQVQPTFVPGQELVQCTFGVYAGWLVADVLRDLLTPDEAKKHLLDVRLGLLWTPTLAAGTTSPANLWTVQLEFTPRYELPLGVLGSVRSRVSFNWDTLASPVFYFRYRGRLQVEREFNVGDVPVTPYVNAELFWQAPPAMWTQFRLQGGVQVGLDLFARGQTIEVNFSPAETLQPQRTWTPIVGIILGSYF